MVIRSIVGEPQALLYVCSRLCGDRLLRSLSSLDLSWESIVQYRQPPLVTAWWKLLAAAVGGLGPQSQAHNASRHRYALSNFSPIYYLFKEDILSWKLCWACNQPTITTHINITSQTVAMQAPLHRDRPTGGDQPTLMQAALDRDRLREALTNPRSCRLLLIEPTPWEAMTSPRSCRVLLIETACGMLWLTHRRSHCQPRYKCPTDHTSGSKPPFRPHRHEMSFHYPDLCNTSCQR